MKIAFIGAGRMAEALISSLYKHHELIASDIQPDRLQILKQKYGIKTAKNNFAAFHFGKVVILAVKPQNIPDVVAELALPIRKAKQASPLQITKKLLISIAAGIPLRYLQKNLPGSPLIRAMPNNPALVGKGITALVKGKSASPKHLEIAKKIFKSVGEVIVVPEKWMDAVTGLSGSGPAFVYQAIQGMIQGGVRSGLPETVARKLALSTIVGAAKMVEKSKKSPPQLISLVASPGGTTIEGLKVLEKYQLVEVLTKAVWAAAKKSQLLSRKL